MSNTTRQTQDDDRDHCEECGAINTEHVDVRRIDDPGYGTQTGKADMCEYCIDDLLD